MCFIKDRIWNIAKNIPILIAMKPMYIMISMLLFVMLLSGCTTTAGDHPYQADLHELYTSLPSAHKDFFQGREEQSFKDFSKVALDEAPSMDAGQFYFTLRRLASFAQDSHTTVGLTQEFVQHFHAIPAQMMYLGGTWRLSVVETSFADFLGAEVVAINGVPIEEVEALASPLFGHDNEVWFRHSLAGQLNLTELYSYIGIAEQPTDEVALTIIARGETEHTTIRLLPVKADAYAHREFAILTQNPTPTGPSQSYYRAFLLENRPILFIQYNVCADDPSFPVSRFTEEVLKLIQLEQIPKILIDLRYNSGGDSRLFEPMIAGLAQIQKETDLSIDVLIGENTFSSALMNAKQCKERLECRLVGTPSGGSVNHYGEVKHFVLPNSKLPVFYSTKYFVMDKHHKGTSLEPDLYVEASVEDLLAGRDTVVETLLDTL